MRKILVVLLTSLFVASFTTAVFAKNEIKKTEMSSRGYCGDGILNGNEECDGNDLNFTTCSHLKGGEGKLSCQPNCLYDISGCGKSGMAAEVNTRIGGLAEMCSCDCDSQRCSKDCSDINNGATCSFDCDNACVCKCEGNLMAHVENCGINCVAVTSISGHPDVECALSNCKVLAAISPNIGSLLLP